MRLTLHRSLTHEGDIDLEVTRGTATGAIIAGFHPGHVWCGAVELGLDHKAGDWPLVAGAILSARPGRPGVAPGEPHLAAFAGPDAGLLIPVHRPTVLGSAPARDRAGAFALVRDPRMDAHHATVSPAADGALRVRDGGSVNGVGVWVLRAGAPSWRGRRRTTTVGHGAVLLMGETLLELRATAERGPSRHDEQPFAAASAGVSPGTSQGARRTAMLRSWIAAVPLARAASRLRGPAPPPYGDLPDPTTRGGWEGPIAVCGEDAMALARAVILARGRRPPEPAPLDEPWLTWLPPACAGDGAILIAKEPPQARDETRVLLVSHAHSTTVLAGGVTTTGPALRVRPDTAEALARARACLPDHASPRPVRWADADALASPSPSARAGSRVVTGIDSRRPHAAWTIDIGASSPHTLVAGAEGSGKTTLLATIAGALAIHRAPRELALVILCAADPGPLEPYLSLPHVRRAASRVRTPEALRALDLANPGAAMTVIIVDDIDALGPGGREVTARLEAIASQSGGRPVHVVISTRRPTAVLTPSLRASLATAIALRTDSASDSVEVTGIEAAAAIPRDAPGLALARSAAGIDEVRVALPIADSFPQVHRWGAPLLPPRTLADVAMEHAARHHAPLGAGASSPREHPGRGGQGPTAS